MAEIKDYYLIGDLHSAALVSKDASIDWLCLPHFDSPSIFAKLLDENGGSFSVDKRDYTTSSEYRNNTAIVACTFKNAKSEFQIHDFMVPQAHHEVDTHFVIRNIHGVHGTSQVTLYFSPKANYAKDTFDADESLQDVLSKIQTNNDIEPALILQTEKEVLVLYLPTDAEIAYENGQYEITCTVHEGEIKPIILEYASDGKNLGDVGRNFEKATENFWEEWVSKGRFFDFCRDKLIRSAITLKLMQFYPTGALVAAPTTSLPEELGGVRNWDYRYVWIRDATFTLYAFYVLGYTDEAEKFFNFIKKIVEECSDEDFDISLFYTIEGGQVPNEQRLEHLAGYKNSPPVRIGNGAKEQFQLDVYGALLDAQYFSLKHYEEVDEIHAGLIMQLVHKIEQLWQTPDRGIWEVRTGDTHFTYSKVMAWVGADRAARLFEMMHREQDAQRCISLAKEIKDWIWANCYDEKRQIFLQHPETKNQDATNFLFVLLQFLDKHDPLTKTIIENTCRELCNNDVFVYRYLGEDGLPRGEGAFILCSFWLISALAILEDTDRAASLLSKIEGYMNESYLLSEEVEPNTGEYLGNYPQAFSHQGFIMAAYYIDRYSRRK